MKNLAIQVLAGPDRVAATLTHRWCTLTQIVMVRPALKSSPPRATIIRHRLMVARDFVIATLAEVAVWTGGAADVEGVPSMVPVKVAVNLCLPLVMTLTTHDP